MDHDFDPYYKWLAIPAQEQPPNHYRLLGVPLFTDDPDVIENLADQRVRHVRCYQSGTHADIAHEILNEIAGAKICLLDPERKAAYDAFLNRETSRSDSTATSESTARELTLESTSRFGESPPPLLVQNSGADSNEKAHKPTRRRSRTGPRIGIVVGVLACLVLGYLLFAQMVPDADIFRFAAGVDLDTSQMAASSDDTTNTGTDPSATAGTSTQPDVDHVRAEENDPLADESPTAQAVADHDDAEESEPLETVAPLLEIENSLIGDQSVDLGPLLAPENNIPSLSELLDAEVGVVAPKGPTAAQMFRGRSGVMKQALLSIYGGTKETEEAVARGLEWLKRNQRKNGSWSMRGPYNDGAKNENECAATAMALLAFSGSGNTHREGEYREVVEKGLKFLVGQQNRNGLFARDSVKQEMMYAQAQATIAFCELYGMTKDNWLRPRAQLAIDFAVKSQSKEGGWRYEPNVDSDTSVTAWFVMAMESGRVADLEIDNAARNKVSEYLDSVAVRDGAAYSYKSDGKTSSHSMTAAGLLCRQHLSWGRDNPHLQQGIADVLRSNPLSMSDQDVYYWYYFSQVVHHVGGDPWRQWNEVMRVELPKAQSKNGREAGSWPPQKDRWGKNYGRLYCTCLSLLCLETYYRHMPLYPPQRK